jgi:hypothetical protein
MKNKIAAYLMVFTIAFVAAVLIFQFTQKKEIENFYALSVIPEDPIFLLTINSFEEIAVQIKHKADFLGYKDTTPYNTLLDNLGLKVTEPIKNSEELKAIVGLCPLSPVGIAVLDPSPSATLKFFCLDNEAIFKDFLKKNYDLTEHVLEGMKYYKLTSVSDPSCCKILYIKNATAFLFENEYTLKKVFNEESSKIGDNRKYEEFKKKYPNASAHIYINSKKLGSYIANMMSFFKPSISQQISFSIKDKELAAKSQVLADALGNFLDVMIKFFKSQDSIFTAVVFDKEGVNVDSDFRLVLSENTQKIFSEKPSDNMLINNIPEGAILISSDNASTVFHKWLNEILTSSFTDIFKHLNPKNSSSESLIQTDESDIFAMYPCDIKNSPFLQLNISLKNPQKDLLTERIQKFNNINNFWDRLSFLLPIKLHFEAGKIRSFNGIQIQQCKLDFFQNKKSLIMEILQKIDSKKQVEIIVPSFYPFELAEFKGIEIFVGNDPTGKFMNDYILQLGGKKIPMLVDTDSYKFIREKAYIESSYVIYISAAQYLYQIIAKMSDIPISRKDILKTKLGDLKMNYNMINIKLHQNGIYCRLYFNFKDIKQFIYTARVLDSAVTH